MVIEKLVREISRVTGADLNTAVIAVPASFGDRERRATMEAGLGAGLDSVDLVNEPTAVAMSYGYGLDTCGHRRIMVFDLGGGTLDISILDIRGDEFTTVAGDCDGGVGGRDFDKALSAVMFRKVAMAFGLDPDDFG